MQSGMYDEILLAANKMPNNQLLLFDILQLSDYSLVGLF